MIASILAVVAIAIAVAQVKVNNDKIQRMMSVQARQRDDIHEHINKVNLLWGQYLNEIYPLPKDGTQVNLEKK